MHTVSDPNNVLLAGDIIDWATTKTAQLTTLIKLIAALMVVVAVLMTYWRTKSWVGTLVAFCLGALVLWGIANMPSLSTKVGSEVNSAPAPHPVVRQITPDAPLVVRGGHLL